MPCARPLVVSITLALSGLGCGTECLRIEDLEVPEQPVALYRGQLPPASGTVAILGDTQRTSWQECTIGREVNDREQLILIESLRRASPDLVVLVGDAVFDGSSAGHWSYFDWLMRGLREDEISILPALGNHDYWGDNDRALARVRERFPRLSAQTWYADVWGSVGMIWLDSNVADVGDGWEAQRRWFETTLADLDARPDVRGVLVFLHHPPYTNSTVIGPDEAVRSAFVGPFCDSQKTLAMFSGHAHGYERFERGAAEGCGARTRQLIVSGGGGGPRPSSLRQGAETGQEDAFVAPAPRPFNYVLLTQSERGLSARVVGLDSGERETREIERYELAFE